MESPAKTTPKDFFIYVFVAGTLYFSASMFITLLWQLINLWFPDYVSYYDATSAVDILRWAIAMILVIFPAYIAGMWWIGKDIDREPAKRELWVRRWFIWGTLFAAAVTVLIDLVYLVYVLLSGEIAERFLLKAVSVGLIAGAVFGYHWYILHRAPGTGMKTRKIIAGAALLAVIAAITAGFFATGTPNEARAIQNDQDRVSSLERLQWDINNFYRAKQRLPKTLEETIDPAGPMPLPIDPKANQSYKYEVRSEFTYALCATFEQPSLLGERESMGDYMQEELVQRDSWVHEVGETCFERTIDPERYQKNNEPTL